MGGLLFQVSPRDPIAFGSALALFLYPHSVTGVLAATSDALKESDVGLVVDGDALFE